MKPAKFPLPLFLAVAFAWPAAAEESTQYQNLLTPLFKGNETIIGQTIAYPSGTPNGDGGNRAHCAGQGHRLAYP